MDQNIHHDKNSIRGNFNTIYYIVFHDVKSVACFVDAKLSPKDITGIGISTQRSSFITWERDTEEYFHNFITWKDLRADSLVKKWNSSITLKTINTVSYLLYLVSRNKRFLAGSVLKMMNAQV